MGRRHGGLRPRHPDQAAGRRRRRPGRRRAAAVRARRRRAGRGHPGRGCPAVGRRPGELELPDRSVVVAVVRGERVLAAGGSDPLEPGDEVLVVTALATEPALRQSLGGHPGGSHIPGG
ncbi:MAG TPA: TrkA C-terminal domain-containing protein [Actinomycetota bacterium]|nr:TrkA C-terminal domain-containing protein [Actinomycetota bacterium]